MNYSNIKFYDISNGIGVRTSLFVSGCHLHCRGCFNQETWNFDSGEPFTDETVKKIIDSLTPDYITGLSILGGEPLAPENRKDVDTLVNKVKFLFPTKDIWLWTGYVLEDLLKENNSHVDSILNSLSVIVDGPFEEDKKDITLRFRGSSNQRLLNSALSLMFGKPVEWHDIELFEKHEWK